MADLRYFKEGSKAKLAMRELSQGPLNWIIFLIVWFPNVRVFSLAWFSGFSDCPISCFFHFLEAENAVGNSENTLFSCYHDGVPCDWFCDIVFSHIHISAPCDWFWAGLKISGADG